MEFKGTQGTWSSYYDDNGFYYVIAPNAPSPYIVATGGESDEDKANAHLIAAAPELLRSAIALLADLEKYCDMRYAESAGNLRQAISKALTIQQ